MGFHGSTAYRVIHAKDIRNVKNALRVTMLSCKNSGTREDEPWSRILANCPIRFLMTRAAAQSPVVPRELSFTHAAQVWLAWSHEQFRSDAAEDLPALFRLIACMRVGKRSRRIEPRAVKQRPRSLLRLNTTRQGARRNISLLRLHF